MTFKSYDEMTPEQQAAWRLGGLYRDPEIHRLLDVLEAAERGLSDAEKIIESRAGPGSWVGSLILNRVRRALAGDFESDVQTDAKTLGNRVREGAA